MRRPRSFIGCSRRPLSARPSATSRSARICRGGMDSGSITAIASRHLPRLRTFTGGFDLSSASGLELGFDERRAAEMMANRCKTEHYEVVLHAGDMEAVLPELIWHLEDLRVGQSYPNYYVARLAGKFVKVVLSGRRRRRAVRRLPMALLPRPRCRGPRGLPQPLLRVLAAPGPRRRQSQAVHRRDPATDRRALDIRRLQVRL